MYVIKTKGFKLGDKIKISNNYLKPKIMKDIKMKSSDIIFTEETIKFMIDNYTCEGGVRKLRENMYEIIREINLRLLLSLIHILTLPTIYSV